MMGLVHFPDLHPNVGTDIHVDVLALRAREQIFNLLQRHLIGAVDAVDEREREYHRAHQSHHQRAVSGLARARDPRLSSSASSETSWGRQSMLLA
jgi:hypothetical protein